MRFSNILFFIIVVPLVAMHKTEVISRKQTVVPLENHIILIEDSVGLQECVLCLESYDDKKKKRIDLQCDPDRPDVLHSYCKLCLKNWLRKKNDCPLCRRPVVYDFPRQNVCKRLISSIFFCHATADE